MTTAFEVLYAVGMDIWTNPRFAHLTANHDSPPDRVQHTLRESITALSIPGEPLLNSQWGFTRIFCRNFVNRAQAVTSDREIVGLLSAVEATYQSEEERLKVLPTTVASRVRAKRVGEFVDAVSRWVAPDKLAALGDRSYLEWFNDRWLYWQPKTVDQIDVHELLADLAVLTKNKETRIKGMGLPLAANFFADTGLSAFCKPDLHVMSIIGALVFEQDEEEVFKHLVRIAKRDNERLRFKRDFNWLNYAGGLMPRHLDKLVYLIGSDNLHLNGNKNKKMAPARRALAKRALMEAGLMTSSYRSADDIFKL